MLALLPRVKQGMWGPAAFLQLAVTLCHWEPRGILSHTNGQARWDAGWGGKLESLGPGEPDHLDAFQQGISLQVAAQSRGECLEPCRLSFSF